MDVFGGVYKGKKVLVTGHTGFKGSWLCVWLHQLQAEVIGYALPVNTKPSMYEICCLEEKITSIIGDINDLERLRNVMDEYQPEIIFHLAAQALVRESYKNPKLTYETNVIGTLNVYEASRTCSSVKAIVCITTDKCYENKEWVYGYRECDPLGGYDPYSSSKACAELLTGSYKKSYFDTAGIQVATVRAGNVIGGGDWAKDRLIPDTMRALESNKEIVIRNPYATRPWQHVLEPLSGYLWLGYKLLSYPNQFNLSWNFGPNDGENQTVETIVKETIKCYGKGAYIVTKEKGLHEANVLKLDISKAKNYLKWFPVYNYKTAIKKTTNWYFNFYYGERDMYETTVQQINEYILQASKFHIEWTTTDFDD